jgi:hypothetical protein
MTLVEMKSMAYDCLANIEHLQKKLQEINQAIAQKIQEESQNQDLDGKEK